MALSSGSKIHLLPVTYPSLVSDVCDPAIEEHFRRSLGRNYPEYLSRQSSTTPSPPPPPHHVATHHLSATLMRCGTPDSGSSLPSQGSKDKNISITGEYFLYQFGFPPPHTHTHTATLWEGAFRFAIDIIWKIQTSRIYFVFQNYIKFWFSKLYIKIN